MGQIGLATFIDDTKKESVLPILKNLAVMSNDLVRVTATPKENKEINQFLDNIIKIQR